MRVTRKMLQSRVDRLNVILNRPATGWTRLPSDPKLKPLVMRANEGHFLLSTYSPGDGWTRYKLSVLIGEEGGESDVSPSCTAQEMWTYLRGVFDVLDSIAYCDGGKHTFAKYPEALTVPANTGCCIHCGARLDIPENRPTDADKQGKVFAGRYCVKCLARRPRQEVISEIPATSE
jgi:hypothetical protein